jgi:hypothetical protein
MVLIGMALAGRMQGGGHLYEKAGVQLEHKRWAICLTRHFCPQTPNQFLPNLYRSLYHRFISVRYLFDDEQMPRRSYGKVEPLRGVNDPGLSN